MWAIMDLIILGLKGITLCYTVAYKNYGKPLKFYFILQCRMINLQEFNSQKQLYYTKTSSSLLAGSSQLPQFLLFRLSLNIRFWQHSQSPVTAHPVQLALRERVAQKYSFLIASELHFSRVSFFSDGSVVANYVASVECNDHLVFVTNYP